MRSALLHERGNSIFFRGPGKAVCLQPNSPIIRVVCARSSARWRVGGSNKLPRIGALEILSSVYPTYFLFPSPASICRLELLCNCAEWESAAPKIILNWDVHKIWRELAKDIRSQSLPGKFILLVWDGVPGTAAQQPSPGDSPASIPSTQVGKHCFRSLLSSGVLIPNPDSSSSRAPSLRTLT